jgi:hypothetical protein
MPIGSVLRRIALVGGLNLVNWTSGDMARMQYAATKANWTMVKVMGNRKCCMMAFPVLEDIAEVMYHTAQSAIKRALPVMSREGMVAEENDDIILGLLGWRYDGKSMRER